MTTETAEEGPEKKPPVPKHPIDEDIRRLVFQQIGRGKKIGPVERRHMQNLAAQWQIARNLADINESVNNISLQSIYNTASLIQSLTGRTPTLRSDKDIK